MSTPTTFGELDSAQLGALVFELASQLHLERTRRLALEAALVERGVVTAADIEAVGASAAFRHESGEAADLAVRKMLRVLSESADERVPLRAEASPPGEAPRGRTGIGEE
jgi:hypothetical protein